MWVSQGGVIIIPCHTDSRLQVPHTPYTEPLAVSETASAEAVVQTEDQAQSSSDTSHTITQAVVVGVLGTAGTEARTSDTTVVVVVVVVVVVGMEALMWNTTIKQVVVAVVVPEIVSTGAPD